MVSKNEVATKDQVNTLTDEQILALVESGDFNSLGNITNYSDVAPGLSLVTPDELVGVPFTIIRATEHLTGDYGPFISLVVVWHDKEHNRKVGVLNNGSLKSGIFQQMSSMFEQGVDVPLYVEKGLRKSEYNAVVDGKTIPAKTFYLSN